MPWLTDTPCRKPRLHENVYETSSPKQGKSPHALLQFNCRINSDCMAEFPKNNFVLLLFTAMNVSRVAADCVLLGVEKEAGKVSVIHTMRSQGDCRQQRSVTDAKIEINMLHQSTGKVEALPKLGKQAAFRAFESTWMSPMMCFRKRLLSICTCSISKPVSWMGTPSKLARLRPQESAPPAQDGRDETSPL